MIEESKSVTCATIKWGDLYSSDDVNKLFNSVKRCTTKTLRFYCMTESPEGLEADIIWLPLNEQPYECRMLEAQKVAYHKRGALRKIALFNPEIYTELDEVVLILDVDILIVNNIDVMFDFSPGHVAMRRTFSLSPKPFSFGQGSIIKIEPKLHGFLYKKMAEMPEKMVALANGSEQSYTSIVSASLGALSFYPDDWIVSFKYHCRPRKPLNFFIKSKLPANAKIVCFHGKPDIKEAAQGYLGNFWGMSRPADWIYDFWK